MTGAMGATVQITNDTTLTWADSALYSNDNVTVTSNAVLTLEAHTTYGTLVLYHFGNLTITNDSSVVCKGQNASSYDENAGRGQRLGA